MQEVLGKRLDVLLHRYLVFALARELLPEVDHEVVLVLREELLCKTANFALILALELFLQQISEFVRVQTPVFVRVAQGEPVEEVARLLKKHFLHQQSSSKDRFYNFKLNLCFHN